MSCELSDKQKTAIFKKAVHRQFTLSVEDAIYDEAERAVNLWVKNHKNEIAKAINSHMDGIAKAAVGRLVKEYKKYGSLVT